MAGKQPKRPPPPPSVTYPWALKHLPSPATGKHAGYIFNDERNNLLREAWRELDEIESRVGLSPTPPRWVPQPTRPDPGVREKRFTYDDMQRWVMNGTMLVFGIILLFLGIQTARPSIIMVAAAFLGFPLALKTDWSGGTESAGPK